MIIGQTLFCDTEAKTFHSPWFPRGGAGATFSAEIIAITSNASLVITPQTKNSESDDQVAAGSVVQLTTSGAVTSEIVKSWFAGSTETGDSSGCLELVRFKYVLSLSSGTHALVHLRMLNPSWASDGS